MTIVRFQIVANCWRLEYTREPRTGAPGAGRRANAEGRKTGLHSVAD